MSTEYVAGGYLLAKPGPTLPKGVLTASACLADMAPDCWALEWVRTRDGEREERAARLGLQATDVPALVRWATEEFGRALRWPNVFTNVGTARDFYSLFQLPDLRLLGIALPAGLVEGFLAAAAPPAQQEGYAPAGHVGISEILSLQEPLAQDGVRRGHEVLGYDEAGQFDSFRCNALETDFQREFGVTFNEWGLLDDIVAAQRCADYASRPEVGTCARTWHPWLVEEYAL